MAVSKNKQEAQQPLILRAHRLMEAFAKSDDERDFYLDRLEGFIVYVDLDKSQDEISALESELAVQTDRYCMIPKLTFYEAKKIMEGFVNEKVYDIDTKEKLLDIIQSKEARTNFLEFIYDHLTELEKWQQYYQERSRVRIIEWLRQHHFHFVFEEDLEFARSLLEKLKQSLFEAKVGKDILAARKTLIAKAKSYYSNEALNPRPKRGRPPKQAAKQEIEPQITSDVYISVPSFVRPFLFTPDISNASSVTFSSDFDNQQLLASRKNPLLDTDVTLASLQEKLATLKQLSTRWTKDAPKPKLPSSVNSRFDDDKEEDEEDFDELNGQDVKATTNSKKGGSPGYSEREKTFSSETAKSSIKSPVNASKKGNGKKPVPVVKGTPGRKQKHKRIIPIQKEGVRTGPLKKVVKTPVTVAKKQVTPTKKSAPIMKKQTSVKKPVSKPAPAKKPVSVKKATVKKAPAKKAAPAAKKAAVKRPAAKSTATKKPTAKKAVATKSVVKRPAVAAKKPASKANSVKANPAKKAVAAKKAPAKAKSPVAKKVTKSSPKRKGA